MFLFNEVSLCDFRMDKISSFGGKGCYECVSAVAKQLYGCIALAGCSLNPFQFISAPHPFNKFVYTVSPFKNS